jgi:glycosyltransferase involved in cell wall biosynthesis
MTFLAAPSVPDGSQPLSAGRSLSARPSTLYVSYEGLLEPLGESQVLGYVDRLTTAFDITIISFEKIADVRDGTRMADMRARLAAAGIHWVPLQYHKRPPAISTAFDVCRGIAAALAWSIRTGGRIVHARGYVSALIALALRAMRGTLLLFDMRGFWGDEKVDAGHWARDSRLYRMTKAFERRFFESADAIVSLTHAGVREFPGLGYRIRPGIPIEVIPTCTDVDRFAPGSKDPALAARFGLTGHLVLGCVGTMSNWYLREPMLDYLAFLLRRIDRLKILVVTAEDHEELKAHAVGRGVSPERLVLTRTTFSQMPAFFRLMDVGMFFIKPVFSKKGSAATKLGEFLASGVPVVINEGVGDSAEIVRGERIGVVLSDLDAETFAGTFGQVRALFDDPEVRLRCRHAGMTVFNQAAGAAKYEAIYTTMLKEAR